MAGAESESVKSNWTMGLGRSFARHTEHIKDFSYVCERQIATKLP